MKKLPPTSCFVILAATLFSAPHLVCGQVQVTSFLNTIATDDPSAKPVIVYQAEGNFEAPNWTRDGLSLIFDKGGRILQIPARGGEPTPLNVGAATR